MKPFNNIASGVKSIKVLYFLFFFAATAPRTVLGIVDDDGYDCLMRSLAFNYTQDIVLSAGSGWNNVLQQEALSLVETGLLLSECNISVTQRKAIVKNEPSLPLIRNVSGMVTLYVATTGNDSAAGSAKDPLRTISGAQMKIRTLYPNVASRPSITVLIQPGTYYYGQAPVNHLSKATQYSETSMAKFSEIDSGAAEKSPIVYMGTGAGEVSLKGGMLLEGLSWEQAGASFPPKTFVTSVPEGIQFDTQDQLFINDFPLIRARTPNGKPWIPLDGFNLSSSHPVGSIPYAEVYTDCSRSGPPPPPNPIPHPPTPQPGKCVYAPNITLLTGYPSIPGVLAPFQTPTEADCAQACLSKECCKGYTWHDPTVAGYALQCFLLTGAADPWSRAAPYSHHNSGLCNNSGPCHPANPVAPCVESTVVCAETGTKQVTGSLGVSSAAGKTLAGPKGIVKVSPCLEHPLGLANDWPNWHAQSFGSDRPCNFSDPEQNCANTLYSEYNYPLWYGPWAGGIIVNVSQAPDLPKYKWQSPADMVVHAMADGEWGGCQFRVSSVSPNYSGANPLLNFSYGGWQQARGATLSSHNRYYMEGSLEFIDTEGEWHFDPATRKLYLIPPSELSNVSPSTLNEASVLLTQTDTLIEFKGSSSDKGKRVENVIFANITFSHTSTQFFRPHEETSGGDYSTHRSGGVAIENATNIVLTQNSFLWMGGNAVFLSASVRNTSVSGNLFRWLGTSGVAVQGKTGAAMMDGRDGERMVAAHGPQADNGVRLPTNNLVSHNLFADYGIWDKQSACYHKALAPNNMFLNNICFNSSRHGVNFQDGFGGAGIAEGNVMFNLNRETLDTTAFNAWNRRNYITSSSEDPAIGILVPEEYNEWRRNLVLDRNFYQVRDNNGDGLRNDDGSSYYKHSNNVLYKSGIQFNGGTQIHAIGNLIIYGMWHLGPTPDAAKAFDNTFVETSNVFTGACTGFFEGNSPGIYTGDYNVAVLGTTGKPVSGGIQFCGIALSDWQNDTQGEDMHSTTINATEANITPNDIVSRAKVMLYNGQQ
eukprot:m.9868 g.9868  ORF g.9868 m.9868 type:complete len:1044 (+) comp4155_c0_seq1:84-3215(+)